jgi:uncharacterized membrane protein
MARPKLQLTAKPADTAAKRASAVRPRRREKIMRKLQRLKVWVFLRGRAILLLIWVNRSLLDQTRQLVKIIGFVLALRALSQRDVITS